MSLRLQKHEFEPGHTGQSCDHLGVDYDGSADVCGLSPDNWIHSPIGEVDPDPYFVYNYNIVFYGDPWERWEDLNFMDSHQQRPNGPEIGDELCDGHQAHYIWDGEKWS